MKSLLEILGYRRRSFRGDGFSVRVRTGPREAVRVLYERDGSKLELRGERTGKRWEGIWVWRPKGTESSDWWQIAADLESAFRSMKYEVVVVEK